MWDKFIDFLVDTLIFLFLPLVHMYHATTNDYLFNVSVENATGIEAVANTILIPYQNVFAGRKATLQENGEWHFEPRFPVDAQFWPKMALSYTTLPVSIIVGGLLKGLSFCSLKTRERYHSMRHFYRFESIVPKTDLYQTLGIAIDDHPQFYPSQNYQRRAGDEHHLQAEKQCLTQMIRLLNEAKIIWWLDCGSCLGAHRYGGIIPWDMDIDIAVLLPDFDNVLCALSRLDPQEYLVQDWSSRDKPKSFIKVFMRKTGTGIDVYHFGIDPKAQEVRYILSLENHTFFPEWWKIRERRFTVPTPFAHLFPLKRGLFDGIEVFLPHNPERYLQLRYGENLAPAKVFDPQTGSYEKDLTHPYWQRSFVH
jgi:hypothetical protein